MNNFYLILYKDFKTNEFVSVRGAQKREVTRVEYKLTPDQLFVNIHS